MKELQKEQILARRSRRNHSPAFKAKVALLAVRGELAIGELAKKFDIHPNQITQWKTQLLENAAVAFGEVGKADDVPDVQACCLGFAYIADAGIEPWASMSIQRLASTSLGALR